MCPNPCVLQMGKQRFRKRIRLSQGHSESVVEPGLGPLACSSSHWARGHRRKVFSDDVSGGGRGGGSALSVLSPLFHGHLVCLL